MGHRTDPECSTYSSHSMELPYRQGCECHPPSDRQYGGFEEFLPLDVVQLRLALTRHPWILHIRRKRTPGTRRSPKQIGRQEYRICSLSASYSNPIERSFHLSEIHTTSVLLTPWVAGALPSRSLPLLYIRPSASLVVSFEMRIGTEMRILRSAGVPPRICTVPETEMRPPDTVKPAAWRRGNSSIMSEQVPHCFVDIR